LKVAIIIPPKLNGRWVFREYHDCGFGYVAYPNLMLTLAATILRDIPNSSVDVIDTQLHYLTNEQVRELIAERRYDAAVIPLGFQSILLDMTYTDLPCPSFGVLCAFVDKPFAIKNYELHCTAYTDDEVEYTIVEALKCLANKESLDTVKGLYIPAGSNIIFTGRRERPPLSDLPLPAFSLIDPQAYLDAQKEIEGRLTVYIYSSRGCPFQCFFCGSVYDTWTKVLSRDVEQVISELRYWVKQYSIRYFYFMDSTFAADMNRAKQLCRRIIDERMEINFVILNHPAKVDPELCGLLKKAGCTSIRFGIETMDPKVQKVNNKIHAFDKVSKAIKMTHEAGMSADLFFMVGLPGEDGETAKINFRAIKELDPSSVIWGITFAKATSRLYHQYRDQDKLVTQDWSKLVSGRPSFHHDYWRDHKQLLAQMKALDLKCRRFFAWKELMHKDSPRPLSRRLLRMLSLLPIVSRLPRPFRR